VRFESELLRPSDLDLIFNLLTSNDDLRLIQESCRRIEEEEMLFCQTDSNHRLCRDCNIRSVSNTVSSTRVLGVLYSEEFDSIQI